jgi:hypothetical protein
MTEAEKLQAYRRGPQRRREHALRRWRAVQALLARWTAGGVALDMASKEAWRRVRDELRELDPSLLSVTVGGGGKELSLHRLRYGYKDFLRTAFRR